ncbi:MAG: hypothetical protein ACRC7O_11020, partial [Fimbriiglobus sp.]
MTAPAPAGFVVNVERRTEPYSGVPILTAGGIAPPGPTDFTVEIRYDGVRATTATPEIVYLAPNDPRLHFATQLPCEPGARRVQVVAVGSWGESTLFDGPVHEAALPPVPVPTPAEAEAAGTFGFRAKLRAAIKRAAASIQSGEIFALWRWKARAGRFARAAARVLVHGRRHLLYDLLLRRHRPRSPHAGYV